MLFTQTEFNTSSFQLKEENNVRLSFFSSELYIIVNYAYLQFFKLLHRKYLRNMLNLK